MTINLDSLREGINYLQSDVIQLHERVVETNMSSLPDKTVVISNGHAIFKYSKSEIVKSQKYKDLRSVLKDQKSINYIIFFGHPDTNFLIDCYVSPPYKKILIICSNPDKYLKIFNPIPDVILSSKERPAFVLNHDYSKSEHVGLDKLRHYISSNKVHILQDTGISCKGITLMGVPGTGKTYSSRLIAKILDVPLYELDLTSIFNSLLGETENNIDRALNFLNHKCVLLLDEVDKFFNSGLGNTHYTYASATSKLLKFMNNNSNVFFIMTANKSDGIPPEFMRKGRIDAHFYIDFPNEKELNNYCVSFFNQLKISKRAQGKFIESMEDKLPLMVENNYLFTDLDSYLKEYYTINIDSRSLQGLDLPKSDYQTNKKRFDDIIKWSKDNARAAN